MEGGEGVRGGGGLLKIWIRREMCGLKQIKSTRNKNLLLPTQNTLVLPEARVYFVNK